MSICPKNKSSKARKNTRRAAKWKLNVPGMVRCSKCGELSLSHRVCKACGSYNKREIISQD